MELSISKFIEKSVPMMTTTTTHQVNGSIRTNEGCREWKSIEMIKCIEQRVKANNPNPECVTPMALIRGEINPLEPHGISVYKNWH